MELLRLGIFICIKAIYLDFIQIGTLAAGDNINARFTISVSDEAFIGSSVDFNFEVIAGEYVTKKQFNKKVGLILEDFETIDFSSFDWEFGGNADWTIESNQVFEGEYVVRSDPIGNQSPL